MIQNVLESEQRRVGAVESEHERKAGDGESGLAADFARERMDDAKFEAEFEKVVRVLRADERGQESAAALFRR